MISKHVIPSPSHISLKTGDTRQLVNQTEYTVTNHKYNNIKLPLTMNPEEYGVIIGKLDIDNGIQ